MSIFFFLCSSDSQFTDDLTPTTFKSITQACKTVTQKVSTAIEGKLLQTQKSADEPKDGRDKDRKYGDGDLDPDREKLAKEVNAQLELEKEKFLSSEKPEDDSAVLRRKKNDENDDKENIGSTKNMIAGKIF